MTPLAKLPSLEVTTISGTLFTPLILDCGVKTTFLGDKLLTEYIVLRADCKEEVLSDSFELSSNE